MRATHTTGFIFARSGCVDVAGTRLDPEDVAVLGASGAILTRTAEGSGDAECLVGVGVPIAVPWEKLLGHDGFVVADDGATAAALLARFEREGSGFGRR